MRRPNAFAWDHAKASLNIASHGLDFRAAERFNFSNAMVASDDRRNYGEHPQVASGFIDERLHILVFTMRADCLRVISLRKANKREIQAYVQGIERKF